MESEHLYMGFSIPLLTTGRRKASSHNEENIATSVFLGACQSLVPLRRRNSHALMKTLDSADATQAAHGGRLHAAAREFALPLEQLIDFSANLNVVAPTVSEERWANWRKTISRYPEADSESVRYRLSQVYGSPTAQILPTAGAIEGLYLAARLFTSLRVGIIEPAFSDYFRAFEAAGNSPECIVLAPTEWGLGPSVFAKRLDSYDVVVFGNPNNPTGTFYSRRALLDLFGQCPEKTWIVDEAFIEFAEGGQKESLLRDIPQLPNVLVLRSLTKSWNIPGLRLGFIATSNRKWLSALGKMQPPWSIGTVTEAWVNELLTSEDYERVIESTIELKASKAAFHRSLCADFPELLVHPSSANFFLIELCLPGLNAARLYAKLGEQGILIRVCDSFYGMPQGRFIRVAVRTMAENQRFLEALRIVLEQIREEAA